MMTLPAVSLTMVSACRMGTPLLTSVPSVRVKREMATLLMTGPRAGIFSLNLSQTQPAELGLLMNSMKDDHEHRHARPWSQKIVVLDRRR